MGRPYSSRTRALRVPNPPKHDHRSCVLDIKGLRNQYTRCWRTTSTINDPTCTGTYWRNTIPMQEHKLTWDPGSLQSSRRDKFLEQRMLWYKIRRSRLLITLKKQAIDSRPNLHFFSSILTGPMIAWLPAYVQLRNNTRKLDRKRKCLY